MRWSGSVVLLCLCLGTVSARLTMAQGIYRVIAPPPDTTVIEPDTTIRAPESRTRWAIQPYIGGSSEIHRGNFRVNGNSRQVIRPLVGGRVRLYPSGAPFLSLDLAGHFQLPGFRSRRTKRGFHRSNTRLSQATIDANFYLRDKTNKEREYLTIGAGFLTDHTNDTTPFLHLGIGVEITKSKRITIPVGLYADVWRELRGDEPTFIQAIVYGTVGFNFHLD